MKKVLFITSILFVAVVSTACINNFAVQDLNNKAKAYTAKGDYGQAIERLKSSIDLDPSIFESHYNLAVVYSNAKDYTNAIEECNKAIEMKPKFANTYYTLATTQNNLAIAISKGEYRTSSDGVLYKVNQNNQDVTQEYNNNKMDIALIMDNYSNAIKNFKKYLELAPEAPEKKEIEDTIQTIEYELSGMAN